jgi:hypothetical protein
VSTKKIPSKTGSKRSREASRKKRNSAIDEVVTTTRVRTAPQVEIRRARTLAQALTEPAVAVVKPQTQVVERRVRQQRRAA